MRRPRPVVLAVLAGAACANVGLGACYRDAVPVTPPPPVTRTSPDRAALASSDPLGFLPLESEFVAVIEARPLRASPVWKRFAPAMVGKAGAVLARLGTACGFDPITTLRRVSLGLRDLDAAKPTGVIVVKGIERAATMTCMDHARAADPSRSTLTRTAGSGTIVRDIVTIPGPDGGSPTVFAFADPTTVVVLIGPDASAIALADVLRRGAPLRGSPAFLELLAHVEISDPMWFVISGNSKAFDRAAMIGFKPRAITASASLANGLAASARIRLDAAGQATQIATLAQNQLQAVAAMVEEIVISADDTDVIVRLRMTQDQVDSMLNLLGGLLGP